MKRASEPRATRKTQPKPLRIKPKPLTEAQWRARVLFLLMQLAEELRTFNEYQRQGYQMAAEMFRASGLLPEQKAQIKLLKKERKDATKLPGERTDG